MVEVPGICISCCTRIWTVSDALFLLTSWKHTTIKHHPTITRTWQHMHTHTHTRTHTHIGHKRTNTFNSLWTNQAMVALLRYMARANQAAQTVTHHIHTYRAVFKAPMHIHIGTCTCIRTYRVVPLTYVCTHRHIHTQQTHTLQCHAHGHTSPLLTCSKIWCH